MAGVLVREGSAGEAQRVSALELGALHPKRQQSDLLPFLPGFRRLFAPLPQNTADLDLRVKNIPLEDVECVTNTVVKFDGSPWYFRVKAGKFNLAHTCLENR
jgi:antiviral helicase SKI2